MEGKTALRKFTPLVIVGWGTVFCVALLLSGCVNHPIDCAAGIYHSDCLPGTAGYQTPPNSWYNPSLAPGVADNRRAIDTAECQAYVMQAVSLPKLSAPQTPIPTIHSPNQYNVSGSVNGEPYNATVTEFSSFDPAADLQAANAYTELLNRSSRETAQYAAAVRVRNQLADACMLKRGWTNAYAGQQPDLTPSPTVELQAPNAGLPTQPNDLKSDPTSQSPVSIDKPVQRYDAWQTDHGN